MNSPTEELRALAHALRGHVSRRSVLGDRRLRRWVVPASNPASPPATSQPPEKAAKPVAATEASSAGAKADNPNHGSIRAIIEGCDSCSPSRAGDDARPSRVMFLVEAPGSDGAQEDVPLDAQADQLLTDIIEKGMGLPRKEVAVTGLLRGSRPGNHPPLPAEGQLCVNCLERRINLVQPEVIIALGIQAAWQLLGAGSTLPELRGQAWPRQGHKVLATYHPAFLLRSPSHKKECWSDIRLAMAELGLDPPGNPPAQGR